MLSSVRAKIKSAPKTLLAALAGGLVLLCTAGIWALAHPDTSGVRLHLADMTYAMDVAATSESQARGLSGRQGLEPKTGMVFAFSDTAERCFWMKDMRFAIDMIWLDAAYRVEHIAPRVQPASYPQTYCAPARYVVELAAGEAAKHGLRVGDSAVLSGW